MKMIVGISALIAVWAECTYLFSEKESLLKFKRTYPQVAVILTIICAAYVLYTINSVLLVLFGILLSFCGKFFSIYRTVPRKVLFHYGALKSVIKIQK